MSDENEKQPLINVEDALGLSKPAILLVEKISAGLGGMFAVYLAKQRAEVQKIETALEVNATLENNDIRKRAELRLISQETRKQKNIESIAAQAVKELPSDASVENIQKMDEDWIAYIFKHCDIVSDKEMQLLWARMLAGEATKTGTFSKRTIDIVSKLDKKDAESFTSLCQFVWLEWNKKPLSLIYDYHNSIYNQKEIKFSTLQHLEAIGLVSTHPYHQYYLEPEPVIYHYHNTAVTLQPKRHQQKNGYYIPSGEILLTQAGKELFPISGASWNDEFFNYVIDKWREEGYNPVIQNPATE